MITIKTAEATGAALDWLVAKAEGTHVETRITGRLNTGCRFGLFFNQRWVGSYERWDEYCPSTDWSQGGPIIEREKISTMHRDWSEAQAWLAMYGDVSDEENTGLTGPTPLIAVMRCYVASRFGDEAEVPDELA